MPSMLTSDEVRYTVLFCLCFSLSTPKILLLNRFVRYVAVKVIPYYTKYARHFNFANFGSFANDCEIKVSRKFVAAKIK